MRKIEPVERPQNVAEDADLLLFENWMTVKQFCERLQLGKSTVYELMEQGLPWLPAGAGKSQTARRIPVRRASQWLERRMMP